VLSRLRQRLGAQLSLATVFECSTLESLAAAVDEAVGAGPAAVELIPAVPAVVAAPASEAARDLSDDQLDALLAEMMTDGGAVELPK
jgi:Phosphopantetheine attachment site